jgi:ferric-dicitrate binding protein FerR (iron transport regulator)
VTEHESEILTMPEQRARAAVRQLPRPEADPAYRARLRREFVSGTLTSPLGLDGGVASDIAGTVPSQELDRGVSDRGRVVRGPLNEWARPLAWAAAAVIMVVGVGRLNRGPEWRLGRTVGDGIAVVDRRAIPLEHGSELAAALHPGATIQVPPGSQIEVLTPGGMMIQLTGGAEVVLPRSPGRWFGRSVTADLRHGELRITTGASFDGARLAVNTPEAHVEVTGTTLAVICEPAGTCVCVLEGRVAVGTRVGDMAEVEGGRRRYVFSDGRAPETDDMRDPEREPLGALRRDFESSPLP